ncbi:hypothetical protein [Methyloceanibacter caenitepidi]|uniref:Helicase HerA central domain-containing protein n=1 Tax=Methyloceanibacter caenitepidi TaxID=1384459 RepID=A0A0A8K2H6_9HYPH|nr:hypothetical protein [Methyloceanibacter caenitepidi]BAQ16966.1 hypothetical protein GL4_1510 [Methyloceanibacter caenitepidi]
MKQPIPDAGLDDRLGYVGTAGSGKTYNAMSRVERLLKRRARVVIVDPLGVWWGLRLLDDGKTASPFDVAIFGGQRADLPLTEHAGALIGETVAGMKESAILDLSELGTKASERRFMLAFLTALYKNANGEPVHVIFDEADMWAPQRLLDKEGEAAKLLGMMETIVRRGRIKGFIPWLITQRPAVLSKDVLSQVDGLVAFKLTSSQDRDAIGDWVQGQADKARWREIWSDLPTMPVGHGLVWIPGRGVLESSPFPPKITFDSSRTPKRGERKLKATALEPLDVAGLKDKLAAVEAQTKANDPKALKAQVAAKDKRIAELEKDLERAKTQRGVSASERQKMHRESYDDGHEAGVTITCNKAIEILNGVVAGIEIMRDRPSKPDGYTAPPSSEFREQHRAAPPALTSKSISHAPQQTARREAAPARDGVASAEGITPAKQKILDAIAWVLSLGQGAADKTTVAILAGASASSGAYKNNLGSLRSAGLIDYPKPGMLALTDAGAGLANHPDAAPTHQDVMAKLAERFPPAQMRILEALAAIYPNAAGKEELADWIGASSSSGAYKNNLGRLRSFGVIDYPAQGQVVATERLFP